MEEENKNIDLDSQNKTDRKKETLKRLILLYLSVSGAILTLIVIWSFTLAQKQIAFFDFIGIQQVSFNVFLMKLFNWLFAIMVLIALLAALIPLIKGLQLKKDQLELKKMHSKKALKRGLLFFSLTLIWLIGIILLQGILIPESRYETYIKTIPENTISLTAPIEITFDASEVPIDTSIYKILAYTWTFGDGDRATGEKVSHRYMEKGTKDGRYTVFLTVAYMDIRSGEQFEAEFSTEVVIANEAVSASFLVSKESGELPLNVSFDASASKDPDGEIVAYEWDFDGDGRIDAEGEIVEYTYEKEGEFEVTLTVTDNNGEVDIASMIIEAGSVGGLNAIIRMPLPQGNNYIVGQEYDFSGDDSEIREGAISRYTWDFGDGDSKSGRNVSHVYEESGIYTLTLTVQDAQGNKDIDELEIRVIDEGSPPMAKIDTIPSLNSDKVTGTSPLTLEFDATKSTDPDNDIVEYEWDFDGDGRVDETGSKVEFTYDEVGEFEAKLTVTDSFGNQDTSFLPIEVTEQGIIAKLEVDQNNGEVPLTVHFDASGSSYKEGNIVAYEYDFGDGNTTISGSSLSYKYKSVGTFSASVTVVGDDGERDTATVQIVVRPVSLTACFTVNTDSGSVPLFVSVDPSCSQGTIEDYYWDFGDGDISFDRKPETHIYSEAGNYTITLEITSDDGIVSQIEKEITVK